jgi:alkylhydroperoxidase family enzyme
MQRYILTSYRSADPATREVYDDFMRTTGATEPPIWLQSLGHSAALTRAYWERAKGTLFSGSLPLALKEMIVFVVSAKHGARYCSACHAQNVLNLDKSLAFEDLQGFLKPQGGGAAAALLRCSVVRFASRIVQDANGVQDEDFEALMDEGFSLQRSARSSPSSTWPPCSTSTPAACAWTWTRNTAPSCRPARTHLELPDTRP